MKVVRAFGPRLIAPEPPTAHFYFRHAQTRIGFPGGGTSECRSEVTAVNRYFYLWSIDAVPHWTDLCAETALRRRRLGRPANSARPALPGDCSWRFPRHRLGSRRSASSPWVSESAGRTTCSSCVLAPAKLVYQAEPLRGRRTVRRDGWATRNRAGAVYARAREIWQTVSAKSRIDREGPDPSGQSGDGFAGRDRPADHERLPCCQSRSARARRAVESLRDRRAPPAP